MKYNLPVVLLPSGTGGFLAHCEQVRATATGDTPQEAIDNLREAVEALLQAYGEAIVFQDLSPETEVQVLEVAV